MSRPLLAEPPAKRLRGQGEEIEENVPQEVEEDEDEFRLLEAVSLVQDELNVIEEEEAQKVLMVHKAFLKRKRPLYVERQEAIAKIPDFWLKVLLAHPLTQPYISDGDQFALLYLEAVSVNKASSASAASLDNGKPKREDGENKQDGAMEGEGAAGGGLGGAGKGEELDDDDDDVGFRVTFTFRENPFFSNVDLWKEWESAEAQQARFSEVDWKDTEEAIDLQACLVWNLDPDVDSGENASFFSIFCGDMEDYELGEALRGDIMDNPLEIYMKHDFDAEAEEEVTQDQEGEEEEEDDGDDEDGGEHEDEDEQQEHGLNGEMVEGAYGLASNDGDLERDGDEVFQNDATAASAAAAERDGGRGWGAGEEEEAGEEAGDVAEGGHR